MPEAAGDEHAAINDGSSSDAGVGATLRAARDAAGLDLKQLATRTRVTVRHLEALEQGDYGSLPGRPYALGFGRSYARAVGLDETDIAERIRGELDSRAPPPPPRVIHQFEVGDPQKTPSRLVNWLALLLAVAVVGAGLVFWRTAYWPAAELPPLVGSETASPTPGTAGRQPSNAAPAASGASPPPPAAPVAASPVVFTALEDKVWVKFYDGAGTQLMQKQMAKGEAYTVPPEAVEPKLWTARPDALAVTVAGKPVPPIADRQRIVKDVAVSVSALLARPSAALPAPAATPAAAAGQAGPIPS